MTSLLERPQLVTRDRALDAFRGLAVLLMLTDHLCLVFGGPELLRDTVGRLAMPAFFVLAGHLATSPRWRHLGIALLGLALTAVVPWIDSPNVLEWWAVGVVLLWVLERFDLPAWLLILPALITAANGYIPQGLGYFDPWSCWALMALGRYVPRDAFGWANRAPAPVAWIGSHPVAFYAGHVLALHALSGGFS